MTNLLIIAICTLAGAFGIMVLTGGQAEPMRGDRIILAGIGAFSGFFFALAVVVFRLFL